MQLLHNRATIWYQKWGDGMDLISISRYISLLLRHKPEVAGVRLDAHGWANVEELIKGVQKKYPLTSEMLDEIVKTDDKQRFAFSEDRTKIRANQGHSIAVDVELEETAPPPMLWHGTAEKYVASIDATGLNPKSRLYVHLSKDEDTARKVGARHGTVVLYTVDSGQMYKDGFPFFLSQNGVWLTKSVPVKYLKKA